MSKIKIGIVGCGGIAENKHVPALLKNKNAEIVAFCDIIFERAEKFNRLYADNKAQTFDDHKTMLNKVKLDAVFVCTPNSSHCEITVNSLNSGCHVMCEKPMAMNYAECQKMIQARDKAKKLLTIGYQNRYRPDSLYLKKECDKGALGEIYYAKATALRRRAVPTWGVFLDEEKQGGGPLIDIGTHALDLTLFMMNNYEPLYAVGTTYHKLNKDTETANTFGEWNPEEFTVEDSAFGFVVMKNGATIVLESSWALNVLVSLEAATTLCGTKAGADMNDYKLKINGVNNNRMYTTIPDLGDGSVAFFEGSSLKPEDIENHTFINAVLGKGELYVTAEQAATVSMILEGIYESAKTNKPYYFK